ncbi:hypothetical protein GCM10027429_09090 [Marivirga atlantica]
MEPMKKLFLVFIVSFALIFTLKAQPGSKWVTLKGKVLSVSVATPIDASITLESLPYGGDNRVFHSNPENGKFSFKVKEGNSYSVHLQAEGYLPVQDTIEIVPKMESLNYEMVPSGENTLLRLNINFVQSKSEIIEDSYAELDKLIDLMTAYPGMEIQLEGHTDFRGSASANMRLSEERVVEVKNYLTNQGIASNRIKTRAFGGTVPITRENTEEAKLLNRRVEARILKTE